MIGTNKAWASALAGVAVTAVIGILHAYNIAVPGEASTAAQTLLATLLVYYVPHGGE